MKRIEIIFKNCNGLTIISNKVIEHNNILEIFDMEEHKMFFINTEEILYYTIKLIGVENG